MKSRKQVRIGSGKDAGGRSLAQDLALASSSISPGHNKHTDKLRDDGNDCLMDMEVRSATEDGMRYKNRYSRYYLPEIALWRVVT